METKTVEQEIAQADLINHFKKVFGEEGAQMAQEFIGMSKEEQERILILVGTKVVFHSDSLERMALHIALKRISEQMPEDARVIHAVLCSGFVRARGIIKDNEEE